MPPRYQVFLSSTFRDLRDERQAALEAILELGHFPAGMEAFPAADATPWELIKSIIAESDYYILIVGGKYGSTGPEGISYTEMEFNLAVELQKPVLAFVHGSPDQIPSGKTELEPDARVRLDSFRQRVQTRLCRTWTNKENLKAAVLLSLVHAIRTKPAFGWVRNEGLENQELLKRLAALQERHDRLQEELKTLRAAAEGFDETAKYQGLDASFAVGYTFGPTKTSYSANLPLAELFFAVADDMLVPINESRLRSSFKVALIASLPSNVLDDMVRGAPDREAALEAGLSITSSSLADVLRQLLAIGLIEPEMVLRQSGNQGATSTTTQRCWVLTTAGRRKYLQKRARLAG